MLSSLFRNFLWEERLDLGEVLEFRYGFLGGPEERCFSSGVGEEERWRSVVRDCFAS
jgi:hypothetical protein